MTDAKLTEVLNRYADHLVRKGAVPIPFDTAKPIGELPAADAPCHLFWMCVTARDSFLPQGRREKAMRWLGFVQGVLFARGDFTVAELADHSRSDPNEPLRTEARDPERPAPGG